nr:MAG TPA: Radical SAM superfamily [Caudoviricetes sp.]
MNRWPYQRPKHSRPLRSSWYHCSCWCQYCHLRH